MLLSDVAKGGGGDDERFQACNPAFSLECKQYYHTSSWPDYFASGGLHFINNASQATTSLI